MSKTETFLKKSPIYQALILEGYFSSKKRDFLMKATETTILLIPIIIILCILLNDYGIFASTKTINIITNKMTGIIMLFLGIYILMHMFEAYFASVFYFEYVGRNSYPPNAFYTFSAGRILRRVENDNLLIGLLKSQGVGKKIIRRLGINESESNLLLLKQAEVKNPPIFKTDSIPLVKVSTIVNFIYENHADFKSLLSRHGINQKDLEATVNWVIYDVENKEYLRQWWTKERLAKIPGVATDWSFGRTYFLNKYSRNLLDDKEVNSNAITFSERERELGQIQSVLTRSSGANALIIGQPGQEKMEVIWNLCKKIKNGTAPLEIIKKTPLLFLTSPFTAITNKKEDFEEKINTIFSEALSAGNVILVIDNLPRLILHAKQFDLNLVEIIEPYLASAEDQIIALADTEYFHVLIENNTALMSKFEIIMTKPLLTEEIIKIISREALQVEKKYELYFTYPAILEIARSAEYYFPDGVSSDKANDLLTEIAPWAIENNLETIEKKDVLEYVGNKTGIPLSSISANEKDKLMNLENLLMKRVVAQREAVFAVSNALRRNRAGIRNEKRPLGSFMFFGPTGVGKTETAKALAEVYFGDEKLLMRLDMSEYQNSESLARLIGSQENNTPGILSNMLREHPYGVLLLDEFEKTNDQVLNLFLQIIDEGYFSDVNGKKIIARNIMFIATSNAGSEKIFEIINNNKNLKENEAEIISGIIKQGTFRPELLNRFDATILFHPLSKEDLKDIARLMLLKISKKLSDKGITLEINNELINFVVTGGYNATFGARPMNRLIQDTIERHLADLLIREELNSGQTVSFKVLAEVANKDSLKPIVN